MGPDLSIGNVSSAGPTISEGLSSGATCSKQTQTSGGRHILAIKSLTDQPEMVKYYTGFVNFVHFMYFFSCLGPAAYHLSYQSALLSPEDELFLAMIKLRLAKDNEELGYLFGISKSVASKNFKTWLNFMYFQLKELDIWLPKQVVEETMPADFRSKYPTTRVILDATEIPIQKPKNLQHQSATWSSYKNKNTLKCIIGISPRGVVTYISDTYGGSASDRQIIEQSDLLKNVFEPKDSIMADRGGAGPFLKSIPLLC